MSVEFTKNLTYEDRQRLFEVVNCLKHELDMDTYDGDDNSATIIAQAMILTEELYDLKEELGMRIHHIKKCLSNNK